MKLWDYDPSTLLPNLPQMVTFPKLHAFYADWAADLKSKGVDIRLNTHVTRIISRSSKTGITLETRSHEPHPENGEGNDTGPPTATNSYDDMVLCILADEAKSLLGSAASWREKFVLGGARFYDDVTVTHSDSKYFSKVYQTDFDASLAAEPKSKAQQDQLAFAKGEADGQDGEPSGFRPMYHTHSYAADPKKIEMSFDCTNYQHQFREENRRENGVDKSPVPHERHVFQSIFLDRRNESLWTWKEIDPDKIIERKWWHQLGHRWQHYVRVVPGMMWLQGKRRVWFAGSWTLVVSNIFDSKVEAMAGGKRPIPAGFVLTSGE